MDKSRLAKCLVFLYITVSVGAVSASPISFPPSDSGRLQYAPLSEQEMSATEGAFAPLTLLAFSIATSAMIAAVGEAAEQYNATGEINSKKVAVKAAIAGGLTAINGGALLTRNIVAMTVALGLDMAYAVSEAFAEDPTLAEDGVLYRWGPVETNASGVSYEAAMSNPYTVTLAGELSGAGGSTSGIPSPAPEIEVNLSQPAGAGESHYRYF